METKSPTRKIFVVAIILFIIILFGALGWLIYSGKGGSVGEKVRSFLPFLPFGKGGKEITTPPPTGETPSGGGIIVGEEGNRPVVILRKLHTSPVAGLYPFLRAQPGRPTATSTPDTVVRYLERGLGHIYETNMTTLKENRISNETRPKIYEAVWGNSGNGVVIRSLRNDEKTIWSYSITLRDIKNSTSTEEGKSVESLGVFLPDNISELAVSQGRDDKVFYVLPTGDSSVGITSGFDAKKKVQLLESPLKEWLPQWPNDKLITLTTKPSQKVPGLMFFVDTLSGNTTKILGGINGLTTLTSPDGKKVLFSESTGNSFTLGVYDILNDKKTTLSLATLPEKCVWSKLKKMVVYCGVPGKVPVGDYPDAWYQGIASFSDDLWMVDTETGTTTLLASPTKLVGEDIDVTKLFLSPDESFLVFVNKKDSTPWSLKLGQ